MTVITDATPVARLIRTIVEMRLSPRALERGSMSSTLVLILIVAAWVVLNRYILPRLGVPT